MNAQVADIGGTQQAAPEIEIRGSRIAREEEVLTQPARALLTSLHRQFNPRRLELLRARELRQAEFDAGVLPGFLGTTANVRAATWSVGETPADLLDRRVEITGPVDRKMIINALNAPVNAFMADFEDSCSPPGRTSCMRSVLGDRAITALHAICKALALDYAGIDFAVNAAGDVLLFEANATMVIASPDNDPRWAYRRGPISAAIEAVTAMIREKAGVPRQAAG